jgi:hypothetical protein
VIFVSFVAFVSEREPWARDSRAMQEQPVEVPAEDRDHRGSWHGLRLTLRHKDHKGHKDHDQ